ncbi:MAG: hypothetical protein SFX73_21465 [Kofleriaceae bacterium]|nr:hypothetical protein [Kofleriaceae bacterium]
MARRRLREPEPLGRARDVAFGEQSVEREDKIQVHTRQASMNVAHDPYAYHRLDG